MSSVIDERSVAGSRSALPPTAWRWSQQWRDVLFLHWPAPLNWLRKQLPAELEIDTFQGDAWVSLVGFRLEGVRLRGWPTLPFCSQMLELNFRTYVRYRDEPAIHFLTMHANHRLMVSAARWLTPLPYSLARLEYTMEDDACNFSCRPHASRTPLLAAKFCLGEPCSPAEPDSLDAWLTERYVAYVAHRQGRLLRMAVSHEPWQLREVSLHHCQQDLPPLGNLPPKCHYSDGVASLLWPFETKSA